MNANRQFLGQDHFDIKFESNFAAANNVFTAGVISVVFSTLKQNYYKDQKPGRNSQKQHF